MIFATPYPYHHRRNIFTSADQMGSTAVHNDLLRNALLCGATDSAVLIRDSPGLDELRAVEELRSESGRPVSLVDTLSWPEVGSQSDSIVVLKAPMSVNITQARNALGGALGPLCSLVHAVNWPNLMSAHIGLHCSSEPYDALVVPSLAAKNAVLRISEQVLQTLRERFHAPGIQSRLRLEHIPFGIEPGSFDVNNGAARSILGFGADEVVLLYFGRLNMEYKADLEPLLRVFRELATECSNARLVLAGHDPSGQYEGVLADVVQSLGLSDRVTLMADVSPLLKPVLFGASDIFVSPVDNIQESYGLSLLEAMASGLPVVASDWSGYREIVQPGETGFLVRTCWNESAAERFSWLAPLSRVGQMEGILAQRTIVDTGDLKDVLSGLTRNRELRRTMGAAGRRRAREEYSWSAATQRFSQLWSAQLEQFKATANPAVRHGHLDYSSIFEDYAAVTLDSTFQVRRTAYGDQLLEGGDNSTPLRGLLAGSQLRGILRRCDHPAGLRELAEEGDSNAFDSICWLIKKSALGIVRAARATS